MKENLFNVTSLHSCKKLLRSARLHCRLQWSLRPCFIGVLASVFAPDFWNVLNSDMLYLPPFVMDKCSIDHHASALGRLGRICTCALNVSNTECLNTCTDSMKRHT